LVTHVKGLADEMTAGVLGLETDEIVKDWRKLRTEELHNSYFSLDIVRYIK
jgi:hypothetical protein